MRVFLFFTAILTGAAALLAAPPPAAEWEIGPLIRGKNYSVGMPEQPTPQKGGGWSFDFPQPTAEAGHVHYLTYVHGPLTGKQRITMRYRIDAKPTVRFVPQEFPDQPATLSLFFQRAGDSWRARGRHVHYRWYAPAAKLMPLSAGTHQITIRLDDPDWISVFAGRAGDNGPQMLAAIDNAERVGFVMGSAGARGHGVFATGPAKFTLLDFRIE